MTPRPPVADASAGRSAAPVPRSADASADELASIEEELAAAREMFAISDPDCPPWSVETELRRLELRWRVLVATVPPPPSPGGGTSSRHPRRLPPAA
jgi:hypothetical protein